MKLGILIGVVALSAFGLGYATASMSLVSEPGVQSEPTDVQPTSDSSNGLTLDGFPVRGEVKGYYSAEKRVGAEGLENETQVCDVLVVTGGNSRLLERYKALTDEAGRVLINLNLNKVDPQTKSEIVSSSAAKQLTAIITDFEELGHGAGPCYSTLDQVQVVN